MGDTKKPKKKYATPMHPWIRKDIEQGKILKKEYGLTNRKEILRTASFLKKYKDIAKKLIADKTAQAQVEKKQMLDKLARLGLIPQNADSDQVLSLELKDIFNRRLQSIVYRKGLARSMKQARQFITHRHIAIGDKEITAPSYLMTTEEENKLGFKLKSTLAKEDHPERIILQKKAVKVRVEVKKFGDRRDQKKKYRKEGNYQSKGKPKNEAEKPAKKEKK